jgi:hypothetical protein
VPPLHSSSNSQRKAQNEDYEDEDETRKYKKTTRTISSRRSRRVQRITYGFLVVATILLAFTSMDAHTTLSNTETITLVERAFLYFASTLPLFYD